MSNPTVIGLDLSLTCTGVAGAGWSAHIRPKNMTGHPRLAHLVDEAVEHFRNADLVVIEGPSFGGGVKHRHEDLAGLRVMTRHACWRRGIPYALVPPSCRALYATGKGNAGKGEVRTSVADRYGLEFEGFARYDEADAYALLAMGLHWLGRPLAPVPDRNADGLTGCQWPDVDAVEFQDRRTKPETCGRTKSVNEGERPVRILSAEDLKGGFWPDMTGGLCARCHLGIIRGETDGPDPDHPECVAAHEGAV